MSLHHPVRAARQCQSDSVVSEHCRCRSHTHIARAHKCTYTYRYIRISILIHIRIYIYTQVWVKMRRVCRGLRYERHGAAGGLLGATHLSLLKTLETGGRQWIRGTVQREKLKESLGN